jgi:hypothetical protein
MKMSSFKNYSQKDRAKKDSNFNNNPELKEKRNVNQNQINDFQRLKPKWRELCSYFRAYPDRFIDFIQPEDAKIKFIFIREFI